MESLEEFLAGTLEPAERKPVEAHLAGCASCREEIAGFREVSSFFTSLRPDEPVEPAPGFYARVLQNVESQKRQSFGAFLDLAFARRLAFASLLTLTVIAGFLVSRDHSSSSGYNPGSVMAQQNLPSFDSSSPDNMLVTLTSYER
jgi:anti-sigma factor RsiW